MKRRASWNAPEACELVFVIPRGATSIPSHLFLLLVQFFSLPLPSARLVPGKPHNELCNNTTSLGRTACTRVDSADTPATNSSTNNGSTNPSAARTSLRRATTSGPCTIAAAILASTSTRHTPSTNALQFITGSCQSTALAQSSSSPSYVPAATCYACLILVPSRADTLAASLPVSNPPERWRAECTTSTRHVSPQYAAHPSIAVSILALLTLQS
jgi:hypothetical protein